MKTNNSNDKILYFRVLLSSSAKQKSKSKSSKAPQNRTYTRTVISNLTKTINSDSFSKDIDKEFTDSDKSGMNIS